MNLNIFLSDLHQAFQQASTLKANFPSKSCWNLSSVVRHNIDFLVQWQNEESREDRAVHKKDKKRGLPARIKEYLNLTEEKNLEKVFALIKGAKARK